MNSNFFNILKKFNVTRITSIYNNREYIYTEFLKKFEKPKTTNINKVSNTNTNSNNTKSKIEYK